MSPDHLLQAAKDSGGVLYVIALMLLIALVIIIERTWFLQRVATNNRWALNKIERMERLDHAMLTTFANQSGSLPAGRVFNAAAKTSHTQARADIHDCLDEVIMREAPRIDRFLWVLDTIVTLAPLLGLFGTILGMFNAFQVLGNPGNAPTQVTGGVAEALVATASGLFVAMVGMVFFNGLQNRVRTMVHQLDTLKNALSNRLSGLTDGQSPGMPHANRPRPVELASQRS